MVHSYLKYCFIFKGRFVKNLILGNIYHKKHEDFEGIVSIRVYRKKTEDNQACYWILKALFSIRWFTEFAVLRKVVSKECAISQERNELRKIWFDIRNVRKTIFPTWRNGFLIKMSYSGSYFYPKMGNFSGLLKVGILESW